MLVLVIFIAKIFNILCLVLWQYYLTKIIKVDLTKSLMVSAGGDLCYQSLRKCCELIQRALEELSAALLQLPDCILCLTLKMTSFLTLMLCQNWYWSCHHLKLLDPQNLVGVLQLFPVISALFHKGPRAADSICSNFWYLYCGNY